MESILFRPSSLEERKEFYEKEFSIEKVKKWFRLNNLAFPQICAIDAGSDTNIILNKKFKGTMFYFSFSELNEKIKKYLPEDIYYDRNTYANPLKVLKSLNFKSWLKQELVFDIDADNIPCSHNKKQQLCNKCLKKAFYKTLKIKKILENKFNFKKIRIVYSGEGFHVHVQDKKAFFLSTKERKEITSRFLKFPIDDWVSKGNICLIRMLYSLNAAISRKVIPITSNKFSSIEKFSIPKFLKT